MDGDYCDKIKWCEVRACCAASLPWLIEIVFYISDSATPRRSKLLNTLYNLCYNVQRLHRAVRSRT